MINTTPTVANNFICLNFMRHEDILFFVFGQQHLVPLIHRHSPQTCTNISALTFLYAAQQACILYILIYINVFSDASENVKNLSVNPMGHEGIVTKLSKPVTCKSLYRCIYIIHINIYIYIDILYVYMQVCVSHTLCDFISFCGAFFFIGNYALSPYHTSNDLQKNMKIFDLCKQLHYFLRHATGVNCLRITVENAENSIRKYLKNAEEQKQFHYLSNYLCNSSYQGTHLIFTLTGIFPHTLTHTQTTRTSSDTYKG